MQVVNFAPFLIIHHLFSINKCVKIISINPTTIKPAFTFPRHLLNGGVRVLPDHSVHNKHISQQSHHADERIESRDADCDDET